MEIRAAQPVDSNMPQVPSTRDQIGLITDKGLCFVVVFFAHSWIPEVYEDTSISGVYLE